MLLPLLLLACAPPDAVDLTEAVEPSIELLYPPANVGTIPLDADGVLRFLVVADIDNLSFVTPVMNMEDPPPPVDGEGHFHVNINGVYVDAPEDLYYEYASKVAEFDAGQQLALSVTLAANDHTDLDMYTDWEKIIEFEVGAAP
jgi:hypothetical protein